MSIEEKDIILTTERSGTFDVWVETEDEVKDFLKTIDVEWDVGA